MSFGRYNLHRIQTLQKPLQPIAKTFLDVAYEQGIPVQIVQGYRSPQEQQALKDSGKGVTNAGALLSYHNHGLAFDVVPEEYVGMPNWNPEGPLWERLGRIGEGLGLEWGGRWKMKDKPHFQLTAAPIRELKAYFEKFGEIMPIEITPTIGGAVVIALAVGAFILLRPQLKKAGLL